MSTDAKTKKGAAGPTATPRKPKATDRIRIAPPPDDGEGVYTHAAPQYQARGWQPIPVAGKFPPVPGATGHDGIVTPAKIEAWRVTHPAQNVGLRSDGTWVAIDVDHYGDKHGAEQLAKLEAELGALPPTYRSTSRGTANPSGQRFYRIPEGWLLSGKAAADIEIVQRHHRYSVVAPSIHPDSGGRYRWHNPNGTLLPRNKVPDLDAVPDLPGAWLDHFATAPTAVLLAGVDPVPWRQLIETFAPGDACSATVRYADALGALEHIGHDEAVSLSLRGFMLGREGHRGVTSMLLTLHDRFAEYIESKPGRDRREPDQVFSSGASRAQRSSVTVTCTCDSERLPLIAKGQVGLLPEPAPWHAADFSADEAFDGKTLNPEKLANIVNPRGDLALGADGRVWRYSRGVYQPDDAVVAVRTRQVLRESYRTTMPALARDMVTMAEGFPVLSDELGDTDLINTRTGMVHWRSGEIRPHSPSYRSTAQLAAAYDPAARCPRVDAWLAAALEPDIVVAVWEAIAYTVMPGIPWQKAILLLGPGGTGKGTLIRLLTALLGARNVSTLTIPAMADTFQPANLVGKIANLNADAEAIHIKDAAPFKRVIGGDRITGERKHKDAFEFTPRATCWVVSNQVPSSNDATTGWLRRWLVLPFTSTTPIDGFDERVLHAEIDGVLTKAVRLLPALMAQGHFTESPAMLAPLTALAEASDVVKLWLADDDAIALADPGSRVRTPKAAAYRQFRRWCSDQGHAHPISATELYKRLAAQGYVFTKYNGVRMVTGLDIRPENAAILPPASWSSSSLSLGPT